MYSYTMDNWMLEAFLRLVFAAVLGALIGVEREHHGRSAGLRTQLLAALGAALAIIVSVHFARVFGVPSTSEVIRLDPARVAYGVMVGIGFLGAGVIIRHGRDVRGLTTAASLWCTAAVGMACGFGMYPLAAAAAAIILFALIILAKLDHYIPSRRYRTLSLVLSRGESDAYSRVKALLKPRKIFVVDADFTRNFAGDTDRLVLHVTTPSRFNPSLFLDLKAEMPEIRSISIR